MAMMQVAHFKPDDEIGRQAALDRLDLADMPPDRGLDEIVGLVRKVIGVDFVAINIVDHDRQWTKASAGITMTPRPRRDTFCSRTIQGNVPMQVDDATKDPRFMANPFVTGPAHIRSYLGVPLTTPDGYNIGSLCAFGTRPRAFTEGEADVLSAFARIAMSQIELRQAAREDVLTGALSRRAFLDCMNDLIASEPTGAATLILLDIDHFKSINDSHGHPAGDAVLRGVVEALGGMLRREDVIGRLGGEEFAILAPGAERDSMMVVADRLRSRLRATPFAEIGNATICISLGVAARHPGEGRDDWIARADTALYHAKRQGRDRAVAAD